MKFRILLLIATICLIHNGCKNNNNSVDDGYRVLVEGRWKGEIDGAEMVTTFIEGEFENEPTLTGSTSLSTGESFRIMNGGHNRVDRIWFTLYRTPLSRSYKGTYNIEGRVHSSTIKGTYTKIDSTGKTIGAGNWNLERIYN